VLERYKEELSRPFDEAASFLSSVRTQLSSLCGGAASLSGNYYYSAHMHLSGLVRRRRPGHAIAIADMHLCGALLLLLCEL